MDEKLYHIFDVVCDRFFVDFGRFLGGVWRSCWHSKSIKIKENSVSNKISKTGISRGLFVETKVLRGSILRKNR